MKKDRNSNPVALVPILVFLVLYLGTGIIFEYVMKIPMGFYNVPIIVAFMAAILVACMQNSQLKFDEMCIRDSHKSEQYVKEDKKDNYHAQPRQEHDAPLADGILEVLSDGYGFIRCENFLPGENLSLIHI